MLLTGLQRQAVAGGAVRVDGHPDEPSRKLPLDALIDSHIAGMRAAEPVGHAEPLRRAHGDVGAALPRRAQQRQCEQISGDDHRGAAVVRLRTDRLQVADGTGGTRILQQDTEKVAVGQPAGQVGGHDLDAERDRAGPDDLDRLRERIGIDQERSRVLALGYPVRERHGLSGGGRLVQHGRVGDRQPGEVADSGLEVQEGLKAAL